MAKIVVLPPQQIAPGTHVYGPAAVPVGTTNIRVGVDRTALASMTQPITWWLELSRDAGTNWTTLGTVTMSPGPALDKQGNPLTESYLDCRIAPADSNTRARGSLINTETVTLAVNLTVT